MGTIERRVIARMNLKELREGAYAHAEAAMLSLTDPEAHKRHIHRGRMLIAAMSVRGPEDRSLLGDRKGKLI